MASKEEIELFLREFKFRSGFYDVAIVATKAKDKRTILDLELSHVAIVAILNKIEVVDYCDGPIEEIVYMGLPMWVFGCTVKGVEVYVKISLGHPGNRTLCISFHTPEFSMDYPYKT